VVFFYFLLVALNLIPLTHRFGIIFYFGILSVVVVLVSYCLLFYLVYRLGKLFPTRRSRMLFRWIPLLGITFCLQIPLGYDIYVKSQNQKQLSKYVSTSKLQFISVSIEKGADQKPIGITVHFQLSTPASEDLLGSAQFSLNLFSYLSLKSSNPKLQVFSFEIAKNFLKVENKLEEINKGPIHIGPSSKPNQREYFQSFEIAGVDTFDKARQFANFLKLVEKQPNHLVEFTFLLNAEVGTIATSFQFDTTHAYSEMPK
jgi:hypothetical protein